MRTATLRRQHDAASQLASELVAQVEGYSDVAEAPRIAVTIARLLGLLRIHLALEDKLLPDIIA